jgi:hypothetical protein
MIMTFLYFPLLNLSLLPTSLIHIQHHKNKFLEKTIIFVFDFLITCITIVSIGSTNLMIINLQNWSKAGCKAANRPSMFWLSFGAGKSSSISHRMRSGVVSRHKVEYAIVKRLYMNAAFSRRILCSIEYVST